MELFSEELRIMDRNTVRLMIDEMQEEIDGQKKSLAEKDEQIEQQLREIQRLRELLAKK